MTKRRYKKSIKGKNSEKRYLATSKGKAKVRRNNIDQTIKGNGATSAARRFAKRTPEQRARTNALKRGDPRSRARDLVRKYGMSLAQFIDAGCPDPEIRALLSLNPSGR